MEDSLKRDCASSPTISEDTCIARGCSDVCFLCLLRRDWHKTYYKEAIQGVQDWRSLGHLAHPLHQVQVRIMSTPLAVTVLEDMPL